MKTLSIVIPCFNNSENIADLQQALEVLSKQLNNYTFEVVLVEDGSNDDTYQQLLNFNKSTFLKSTIVKLTGNFGSYNAFLAGLNYATGDVYAHLHPDMQDPPEHLIEMLSYYENGIKFIIGQRIEREDKDTNQLFAKLYHWLMKKIALKHIPEGGYDLIVFDKSLRDTVVTMNEKNINLVYLISWLQFPYVTVPLKRISRKKGKSQWTFNKKYKLLIDSIVGFSYTPIKMMTIFTLLSIVFSLIALSYIILINQMETANKIIITLGLIISNLLLVFLCIIGEYLWRTLEAARDRPNFIVDEVKRNN